MTAPAHLPSPDLRSGDPACPACPHPLEAHDPIGVRFCRATATAGLDRGCVCRAA